MNVLTIFFFVFVSNLTSFIANCTNPELEEEELRARGFVIFLNEIENEEKSKEISSEWNYLANMTEENSKKKIQNAAERADRMKTIYEELNTFDWKSFTNPILRRQFMLYQNKDISVLSQSEVEAIVKLIGDMQKIYINTTVCDLNEKNKCDSTLREIEKRYAQFKNEEELRYYWLSFRSLLGPHIRHLFRDYVHLYNKAAHLNRFKNADEMWLFPYEEFEIKNMTNIFESLWEQVRPLYQQLHAYVRHKLIQRFSETVLTEEGPIPAQLFGSLVGSSWKNLINDCKPFPNGSSENITESLNKLNYTVNRIFKTAEDFYASLGMTPMSETFWEKSIFEEPSNSQMLCRPKSYNFHDEKNYRIQMCSAVNQETLMNAHHLMGNIEYFMLSEDQPVPFKTGINPGFEESIGNTITLSLRSPEHLKKLKLINHTSEDKEFVINNLFEIALEKIPFMSFSYLVDQWRWNVFSGNISHEDYNCKWWEMREEIQGIEPPVPRNESDFDLGVEYHIIANEPHIKHFFSIILQFQLHRALCEKAGQYASDRSKSLHLCNIYGSKEAGTSLKETLKLGNSKPWNELLYLITGQRVLDASALLEYFHPLQNWLEKQNRIEEVHVGWQKSSKICTKE